VKLTEHEAKRLKEAYDKTDPARILGVLDRSFEAQGRRRARLLRSGEVDADYVKRMSEYHAQASHFLRNFQRQLRDMQRAVGVSLKDLEYWDTLTYEDDGEEARPIEDVKRRTR
jgi:hypothetical protein